MTTAAPERGDYVASLLSYTEYTGNVTISATSEATATTIVTAPALAFDGTTGIEIEFFSPDSAVGGNAGGNTLILVLYDAAASIGLATQVSLGGTTAQDFQVGVKRRLVPAAGSHTYSIRAYRTNANCTMVAGAGGVAAYIPGWMKISRF